MMKAFVFKPSNEYIGKFSVGSFDEVPGELQKFMDRTTAAPGYSSVEVNGRRWTLLSSEPFRVETEVLARASQPAKIPAPVKKTARELRFFKFREGQCSNGGVCFLLLILTLVSLIG